MREIETVNKLSTEQIRAYFNLIQQKHADIICLDPDFVPSIITKNYDPITTQGKIKYY